MNLISHALKVAVMEHHRKHAGIRGVDMLIESRTIEVTITGSCRTDADCPCGYACIAGKCEKLVPSYIDMDTLVQKYPFWMFYNNCTGGGCTGFEGENLNACKFGSGLCNQKEFIFTVTGTVKDSNGHPVGCVDMEYSGDLTGKVPFSGYNGEGYFRWGSGTGGKTDKDGKFSITINMEFTISSVNACNLLGRRQNVGELPFTFTITAQAKGYSHVRKEILFEINNTICEQNAL